MRITAYTVIQYIDTCEYVYDGNQSFMEQYLPLLCVVHYVLSNSIFWNFNQKKKKMLFANHWVDFITH